MMRPNGPNRRDAPTDPGASSQKPVVSTPYRGTPPSPMMRPNGPNRRDAPTDPGPPPPDLTPQFIPPKASLPVPSLAAAALAVSEGERPGGDTPPLCATPAPALLRGARMTTGALIPSGPRLSLPPIIRRLREISPFGREH